MRKLLLTTMLNLWLTVNMVIAGDIKWTGAAGDGLWSSAANWSSGSVPGIADDIILDHQNGIANSYKVTLPTLGSITVSSITILPTLPNSILLEIPAAAIQIPVITLTKPGYGLVIFKGGVFRNNSGSTSGAAVVVNDSVMIKNGGRYLQQSRTTHAALVTKLSKAPGTEEGIFEFDIPGTTGYTISITGRTYGTLILSASGGNRSYTSNGSSPLRIRGDFIINPGVAYSIDLNNNILVDGNFIHQGNSLDVAAQSNNSVYSIKGNIYSAPGSVIKETAAGLPIIELSGFLNQQVEIRGSIENSIGFKVNNISSTLSYPLSLPYALQLTKGVIQTSAVNLLTLQAGCNMVADTILGDSYIEGPVRKEGLVSNEHFLFPVGKNRMQRWVALKSATGTFTVEYFNANPNGIGTQLPVSLHHISSVEYWTIQSNHSPLANAAVELSFKEPISGGVNNLSHLRVAQYVNSEWLNQGNVVTTGVAGLNGSVVSQSITDFSEPARFFTLASNSLLNPLPLTLHSFSASAVSSGIFLEWKFEKPWLPDSFHIQRSADGIHFNTIKKLRSSPQMYQYRFTDKSVVSGKYYYRIQSATDSTNNYSKTISVIYHSIPDINISVYQMSGKIWLHVTSALQQKLQLTLIDNSGKQYISKFLLAEKGNHQYTIYETPLPKGIYYLIATNEKGEMQSMPFCIY